MYDYSMEKLVYQMFILGCDNLEYPLKKGLGGVIFFTKDINSEEELIKKIKEIKSQALIQPFISIDQEGGRVERTENIREKRLSARFAYEKGEDYLKQQSEEISKELKVWGFNLNFAPCIDINTNPLNPIIGERAFADNVEDVIEGYEIFTNASRKFGVVPCVKHYPGHGDADKDSHLTLPRIDLTLEEMQKTHLKPFEYATNNDIEMIMVAHLHCTCFDKETLPTSLSKNAIGYLRKNLNYDGVLISDDMVMKGVQAYGSLDAVIKGIEAGLDMFIFRNSDDETIKMIDELIKEVEKNDELKTKVINSNKKISALKNKYKII